MSDEICVCGDLVSEHQPLISGGVRVTLDDDGGLKCGKLRPQLDWPNAEGWWWSAGENFKPRLLFAWPNYVGEFVVSTRPDIFTREEFEKFIGTVRFTRLLEPNPFPSKN